MSRHLGPLASDYVQRRLAPARLAELDRHVITCPGCRARADQERALLSAMRSVPAPSVSPGLRETLLGMASAVPVPSGPSTAALDVPAAPGSARALRLPVVQPATPALHRSPFRATLLAGLAAGASAAVAWALAAPAGASTASPSVSDSLNRSPASVRQAGVPPAPVVSMTGFEASRSAVPALVSPVVPPDTVVSFPGARSNLGRPAVLTERVGR